MCLVTSFHRHSTPSDGSYQETQTRLRDASARALLKPCNIFLINELADRA